MQTVTERSTAYLTASFYDKTGVLQAPASLAYRIDDVMSGQQVRGDTTITPAAQAEITLTAADNAILNTVGSDEKRRVTVTASYGVSDQVTDEYIYLVRNLTKVS